MWLYAALIRSASLHYYSSLIIKPIFLKRKIIRYSFHTVGHVEPYLLGRLLWGDAECVKVKKIARIYISMCVFINPRLYL